MKFCDVKMQNVKRIMKVEEKEIKKCWGNPWESGCVKSKTEYLLQINVNHLKERWRNGNSS